MGVLNLLYTFTDMIQQLIVIALFGGAAFYLGRLIYRSFQSKNICESGCGKCGATDLQKMEEELKTKGF